MSSILKLDQHTTNLIAAGEVIERASSVVKELVENSIDAHARNIVITLVDSGIKEITVSDDGIGMDSIDAKLCIEPHATSKIRNQNDLFSIRTLGFRGEALPSIISISNFKLKTSDNGMRGIMYNLRAGEFISEAIISHPRGTEISVKNLFFNTPARLQNLQTQSVELSYVVDYVNKMALANPYISFKLVNNERTILQTFGTNNLLEVISNTYGVEIAKNMMDVFNDDGYFKVSGYVSKINVTRSNKNYINIIVNGRVIKSNTIVNAINLAYKNYLMTGRYPIAVININVDPGLVDVNVHPAKLEVRFSNEEKLLKLITETISSALSKANLIVDMDKPKEKMIESNIDKYIIEEDEDQDYSFDEIKENESNFDNLNETDLDYFNTKEIKPINLEDYKLHDDIEEEDQIEEKYSQQQYSMIDDDDEVFDEGEIEKIPRLSYIGQLHGTYLLAQTEDVFYIIDQHAAAERINYEKIVKELQKDQVISYELLLPIKLDYTTSEAILINDHLHEILKLGIKIEDFGGGAFTVREVPIWLFRGREKEFIEEIIYHIINNKKMEKHQFLDSLAKSLACKKSIKGNEYVNQLEIDYLLQDLSKCENPYTCPHGRPVIIKFSKNEIERWFKRVV